MCKEKGKSAEEKVPRLYLLQSNHMIIKGFYRCRVFTYYKQNIIAKFYFLDFMPQTRYNSTLTGSA